MALDAEHTPRVASFVPETDLPQLLRRMFPGETAVGHALVHVRGILSSMSDREALAPGGCGWSLCQFLLDRAKDICFVDFLAESERGSDMIPVKDIVSEFRRINAARKSSAKQRLCTPATPQSPKGQLEFRHQCRRHAANISSEPDARTAFLVSTRLSDVVDFAGMGRLAKSLHMDPRVLERIVRRSQTPVVFMNCISNNTISILVPPTAPVRPTHAAPPG